MGLYNCYANFIILLVSSKLININLQIAQMIVKRCLGNIASEKAKIIV